MFQSYQAIQSFQPSGHIVYTKVLQTTSASPSRTSNKSSPSCQRSMRRKNPRILKRPIRLNPRIKSIVVPLPTILPRLVDRRDRQPRLSRRPVKEPPRTPIKSLDLASILPDHPFPHLPLILCPFHNINLITQSLCLSSSFLKLGFRYLRESAYPTRLQ